MKEAYIPAPSRKAVRLVVQTARIRIIPMSIRGSRLRISTTTHAAQSSRPAPISPIVRVEPQPQVVASLIASSTAVIPVDMSSAASQFTRPGTRTGDSGTNRQVPSAAATITTSGIQKIHCQLEMLDDQAACEDAHPGADAEHRGEEADAPGHLLARELVADDAEREREDPAARRPGSRGRRSGGRACARAAARSVPAASTTSVQTSTCSLPYMSPSRPRMAVPTEAESR